MNNKPAASPPRRQPGASWTNLRIEGEEDLTIRQVAEPVVEPSDESAASSQGLVARNVWIEEDEDLTVRPLPPETVVDDGRTLGQVMARTEESRTHPAEDGQATEM